MWKSIFRAIGHFICEAVVFVRRVTLVFFVFLLAVFVLTIYMPNNVQRAIEIFRNIL
jgi:hypothetical protein